MVGPNSPAPGPPEGKEPDEAGYPSEAVSGVEGDAEEVERDASENAPPRP